MDAWAEEADEVVRAVGDVGAGLSVAVVALFVEAAVEDIAVERQRQQDASLAAVGAVAVVAAAAVVVAVPSVLVAFSSSSYLYYEQVAASVALKSLHHCIHQTTLLTGINSPLISLPFGAASSTNPEGRLVCVASTSGHCKQGRVSKVALDLCRACYCHTYIFAIILRRSL